MMAHLCMADHRRSRYRTAYLFLLVWVIVTCSLDKDIYSSLDEATAVALIILWLPVYVAQGKS